MDVQTRYHVYRLEKEIDLYSISLNYTQSGSATIYQIDDTDYFYGAYYFSDGNITDINIYYIRSKTIKQMLAKKGNVIKFAPGTGEWEFHQGELKEIFAWIFVLRILHASSKEIEEIYKLEIQFQEKKPFKKPEVPIVA